MKIEETKLKMSPLQTYLAARALDEDAVDKTLDRMQTDYVDLLFIHQPAGDYIAGYRQLEKAYKEGKARSIGISNFRGEKLEKLLAAAEIAPHVIQSEAHPYCTEKDVTERLEEYGTRLMAWYPLGHGDKKLINEDVFVKLAEKYGKTPAQIVLRWHTQKGFIVIPGSSDERHIKDNIDIFDFELTDGEMEEIAALDTNTKYYNAPLGRKKRTRRFAPTWTVRSEPPCAARIPRHKITVFDSGAYGIL